jgi:hypothetical protein
MNPLQGSISFLFGVQGVPPVPWITRDASGLGRTPDGKLGFPYPKSRQVGLVDEEWDSRKLAARTGSDSVHFPRNFLFADDPLGTPFSEGPTSHPQYGGRHEL